MLNAIPPSLQDGFAEGPDTSEYPELWDGLLGLWAPSLGHQGLTTLREWSGQGNHGTFSGSMTNDDWVTSPYGLVLDFDGTDDFINAGSRSSLDNLAGGNMTLMARINPANFTTNGRIFVKRHSATSDGFLFTVHTTGALNFLGVDGGAVTANYRTAAGTLSANTWSHIAVTFTNSTGVARIFINGVEPNYATATAGSGAHDDSDENLGIGGGDPHGATSYFAGKLGDMRVYKRLVPELLILASALGASPLTLKRRVLGRAAAAAAASRPLYHRSTRFFRVAA